MALVRLTTGVALVFVVASRALAADGEVVDTGILDSALAQYRQGAEAWGGDFKSAASAVFGVLATLGFAWMILTLIWSQADFGQLIGEVMKFLVITGIFYFLLDNGVAIAESLVSAIVTMGEAAGGRQVGSSPSALIDAGLSLFSKIRQQSEFWDNWIDTALAYLLCIAILILLAIVACNMLVLHIAATFVIYGGQVILGFGGIALGRETATNYFRTALSLGMQILGLTLVAGTAVTFFTGYTSKLETDVALEEQLVLLVIAIAIVMLAERVPALLAGLITGVSPHYAMGNGASAAAAVASVGSASLGAAKAGLGSSMARAAAGLGLAGAAIGIPGAAAAIAASKLASRFGGDGGGSGGDGGEAGAADPGGGSGGGGDGGGSQGQGGSVFAPAPHADTSSSNTSSGMAAGPFGGESRGPAQPLLGGGDAAAGGNAGDAAAEDLEGAVDNDAVELEDLASAGEAVGRPQGGNLADGAQVGDYDSRGWSSYGDEDVEATELEPQQERTRATTTAVASGDPGEASDPFSRSAEPRQTSLSGRTSPDGASPPPAPAEAHAPEAQGASTAGDSSGASASSSAPRAPENTPALSPSSAGASPAPAATASSVSTTPPTSVSSSSGRSMRPAATLSPPPPAGAGMSATPLRQPNLSVPEASTGALDAGEIDFDRAIAEFTEKER